MSLVSLPSACALSFSVFKLLYEENKVEASDKWSQILRASFDHLNPQGARMSLCSHNMKCVAILSLCLKACSSSSSQTVFVSIVKRCQLKD